LTRVRRPAGRDGRDHRHVLRGSATRCPRFGFTLSQPLWWAIFVGLNFIGVVASFRFTVFICFLSLAILAVFFVGAATKFDFTRWAIDAHAGHWFIDNRHGKLRDVTLPAVSQHKTALCRTFVTSGRQNLNLRPPGPQPEGSGCVGADSAVWSGFELL
jgi:hypothetical protein